MVRAMRPRARERVTLEGGPFDGELIPVEWGATLSLTGDDVPAGHVARYRPSRTRGVYRFRGYAKIIATLPVPLRRV